MEEEDSRPTRRNTKITDGKEQRRANVLKEETARLEIRRNFFNVRAVKTWNLIPDDVKEKKSVNAFKNAYDAWKKMVQVWKCDARKNFGNLKTRSNRKENFGLHTSTI